MKKTVALILSLMMMVSCLPMAALAAEWTTGPTLSLSSTSVDSDNNFTVKLNLSASSAYKIGSYTLNLIYDDDLVTLDTTKGNNGVTVPDGMKLDMAMVTAKAQITVGGETCTVCTLVGSAFMNYPESPASQDVVFYFTVNDANGQGGIANFSLATDSGDHFAFSDDTGNNTLPLPAAGSIKTDVAIPISSVTLTENLPAPTKGGAQKTTLTTDNANVTAAVKWYKGTETTPMAAGVTFAADTQYRAEVTLTPADNCVFSTNPAPTLTGYAQLATGGTVQLDFSPSGANYVAEYTFPKTPAKAITGLSITAPATSDEFPYGTTLKKTDFTVTATYDEGDPDTDYQNFSWSPTGALTTMGRNTITVTSNEDSSISDTVVIVVVKATPSVTAAPTGASGLTYTGGAQSLLTAAGTTTGGTLYYGIGTAAAAPTTWTATYTDIKGTDAGDYYVWYKVVGGANYEDVDPEMLASPVNIAKVDASADAPTPDTTLAYTGSAQSLLTAAGTATGGTMYYGLGTDTAEPTTWTATYTDLTGTDAGDYYVWYKVTGDDNHNDFTASAPLTVNIAKADASAAAPTAATVLSYDGSAQELLTAAGSASGGTMYYGLGTAEAAPTTWTATYTDLTGTDAGDYYVWYKVTGDDNHNDFTASAPLAVNIAKVDASATAPTAASGLTFTGSDQSLLTAAGTADGGTLYYGLGTAAAAPTTWTATYTDIKGTDAGDYYVWYKVTADDNHNDFTASAPLTVEIGKGNYDPDLTAPTAENPLVLQAETTVNKDYNLFSVIQTIPDNAENVQFALTGTATGGITPSITNSGDNWTLNIQASDLTKDATASCQVTVTSDNYNDKTLTVNFVAKDKKPVTVTAAVNPAAVTYGSTINVTKSITDYTEPAAGGTWTLTYTGRDGTTYAATTEPPVNVGKYAVVAEYSDSIPDGDVVGHYGISEAANFEIVPLEATLAWSGDGAHTYGDSFEVTATVSNKVNSTDDVVVVVSGGTETAASATPYTATATGLQTAAGATVTNYVLPDPAPSTTYTIAKAAITVTVADIADQPYSGSAITPTPSITSSATMATTDYDVSYANNINAGVASLTVSPTTGGNYSFTAVTKTFNITKADLTITANAQTVTYGTDIATGTDQVTATGLMGSDAIIAITLTPSGSDVPGGTITPSAAKIAVAGTDVTASYNITYADGALTINQAAWTVTSSTGEAKFGASGTVDLSELTAPGGTYGAITVADANGILDAMPTISGSTFNFSMADVSAYAGKTATVTIPVTGSTNYSDYDITLTLTCLDKSAQSDFKFPKLSETKTYGDPDFTLAATGQAAGSTVSYSSSDPSVATVDPATGLVKILKAGTTTITADATGTTDYAPASKSYTLTVDKATITVTALSKTITVNGTVPDLSSPVKDTDYTVTGLAGSDALGGTITMGYEKNGSPATVVNTTAGSYDIAISGATVPDTTNYAGITFVPATLTITANSGGGGGGGSAPANTVRIANPTNGKVTVSNPNAKASQTVTITATPNDGYQVDKVTVTDSKGNEIPVTEQDGKYTFVMPASNTPVKVEASFVKAEEPGPGPAPTDSRFVDVPADAYYADAVDWAVDKGITTGTDDTHFSPNDPCTRAQAVTFLWRGLGQPAPTSSDNPFTDVKEGAYYYDAVLWAVENGITKGTSDTTFSPNDTVTRAQIVTLLYRLVQANGGGFTGAWAFPLDFSDAADVPDWAYEAFCWMTMKGVVKGSDGKLMPNEECLRAQIVTLMYRAVEQN